MPYQEKQDNVFPSFAESGTEDFSYVAKPACVAVYDDMKAAPRIITVDPAPTNEFIESLASTINEQRLALGGEIPYTAIREVTENFIHARFNEVVVSVLDGGNTIRFCDQGPGIEDSAKAMLPGFTSASSGMKSYIRGVGSGLPLVREYMEISDGKITIEDNIHSGAVVTISLVKDKAAETPHVPMPPLNERQRAALLYLKDNGTVGNKELADYLQIGGSSAHNVLQQLAEMGLVETTYKSKRILTDLGTVITQQL